jgi:energy-converting hydrogenase Eha subunit G
MHAFVERLIRQFTSVALGVAAILVPLGFAGIEPSLLLALGPAGIAGLLLANRQRLLALHDSDFWAIHVETLWIGPALAASILVVFGSLTSGEMQTIGAVVGLLGMVNYLLRPVYLLVDSIFARLFALAA